MQCGRRERLYLGIIFTFYHSMMLHMRSHIVIIYCSCENGVVHATKQMSQLSKMLVYVCISNKYNLYIVSKILKKCRIYRREIFLIDESQSISKILILILAFEVIILKQYSTLIYLHFSLHYFIFS